MLFLLAPFAFLTVVILTVAWLSIARIIMPGEDNMRLGKGGYVDAWGEGPSEDMVSSVRIGGIGATSYGRQLKVKVMDRKGLSVLDLLSWKIDAAVSPDLMFNHPISSDSIGAVLIAIE